ncbi:MAG: alpha-2-macroglobulin family protein, partial [Acidobacteriota bacterium]
PRWRWWLPPGPTSSQVIAHGESPLEVDGTFEIVFTPKADERLADQRDIAYRYRIHADVTDDGGETRDGQRSMTVGFAAIDAAMEAASPSFAADRPVVFELARTRLSGPAAPGDGSYRVVRLEQPAKTPLPSELPADPDGRGDDAFRTEGDRLRPRWSAETDPRRFLRQLPEGAEVASGSLRHGDDGRARVEVELPGGAYRIHYRSDDEFGETVERHQDFWVRGESALRLPLVLAAAGETVEVGESLALVVHSGFAGQRLVLEVDNKERRILRREIEATAYPQVVEVPITAAERGGVSVTLTAVRDHQWMRHEQRVDVPWTDRRLAVRFERFRDRLRPGTEETFSVVVSGPEGDDASLDPEAVELLAYMYDRSLDLFARHSPTDVISLYPGHYGTSRTQTNLGQAPIVWRRHTLPRPPGLPNLRPASLRYLDGWPIGGPGQRRVRMQSMKSRPMMARAAPAPSPPAPSPAAVSEEMAVADSMPEGGMELALMAEPVAVSGSGDSDGPDGPGGADLQPVRSNFAETAFWYPHLRLDADGAARLGFTVPDSVTEWNVWAHALTRDLRGGSVTKTTRSVKDLLIRPYLPRFLRAGDRAELRLVVSNAGDSAFSGVADVSIDDPETGEDLLGLFGLTVQEASDLAFAVEPGQTATLTVPLRAPSSPRPISITASARAGELSDGERRPLPILPSRLHLAQSRFAAVQGPGERTLRFDDLATAAEDDPSLESESLVITLDGQLFTTALRALPYLVEYPYQCTEQTLNRYLSTGILSRLYGDHPGVAAMGRRLAAERSTLLEPWRQDDPNRRLLLEETPWLQHARGAGEPEGLLKVLDPEVAEEVRSKALGELRKVQTSSGGFPWWPGGPPSPYMTLYTLQGFARGLEFGLDVPKDMTVAGWRYLERYWRDELGPKVEASPECCAPRLTFYAWLLWAFPDASWTGDVAVVERTRWWSPLERSSALSRLPQA